MPIALLLLAWLLAWPAAAAAQLAVDFDGETYRAAHRGGDAGGRLVEFLRAGETLQTWTRLVAVRHFPGLDDPRAAALRLEAEVRRRDPRAPARTLARDDGSEAMVDFVVWPADRSHMEFNVHRYLRRPGVPGVVSYQFAARLPALTEATVARFRADRQRWVEAMTRAEFPLPPPE
jgi:hypothetical protein